NARGLSRRARRRTSLKTNTFCVVMGSSTIILCLLSLRFQPRRSATEIRRVLHTDRDVRATHTTARGLPPLVMVTLKLSICLRASVVNLFATEINRSLVQSHRSVMPLVRIDLRLGKSTEYRAAISKIVYDAMAAVLNVPANDRFQVITEHDSDGLIYDPKYLGIQ